MSKKKTILITGATGFLGSHLVKALLKKEYSVVAIKRHNSKLERLKEVLSELTFCDIEHLAPFIKNERIDCVIHAATNYGKMGTTENEVFQANLHFPLKLLEEALSAGIETFLNIDTVLPENVSWYALSKKQFLKSAKDLQALKPFQFINIRLEQLYGYDKESSSFPMHVIRSLLANVPSLDLTSGEQKRDFIHVEDAVSGILGLLKEQNRLPKDFVECDLGNGDAITISQFVELAKFLTQSDTQLNFGALTYRENELMHSEAQLDFMQKLNWQPMFLLEDGLKKVINEYRSANNI